MIDTALLRTAPDLVRRTAKQRDAAVDLDRIVELDAELRQVTARFGVLRAQQRRHSMSREQVDVDAARVLQDELRTVTEEVRALQETRDGLWARLPNLLPDDTPAGVDDSGNVELRRAGDPVAADETRCHDTVGAALGVLDLTRGADVAVKGVSYWRGDGARLAWAVFTHAQSLLLARRFTPMMTSHTVIGYYDNQILNAEDLPIRVCAFTPCFLSSADNSAADNSSTDDADRGAYRADQFHQIEQIVLCRPEDSEHWFDECQRNVEDILRDLELPYRVARVCVGALEAPAHKAYETGSWFPGVGTYRKTHSNSHFTDYQARRCKIRYLDRGRVAQPHTLAATGVTDRVVLAILENHARPDGSVRIPEALRPYLGDQELIEPKPTRTN